MASQQKDAEPKQLTGKLELFCISKKHIKEATHTWTIQRFLDRLRLEQPPYDEDSQEDILKSDPFFVPIKLARGKEKRIKLELELELNNASKENPAFLGFYVRSLTLDHSFNMKFTVCVKNAEQIAMQLYPSMLDSSGRNFNEKHDTWGWDKAIKKSMLISHSDAVLKEEGSLILVTKLEIECQHSQNEAVVIPTKPVNGHLGKRLWDNKDITGDVRLTCGDVDFKAHKVVLMVSSDVLQAMFSHEDTSESQTGIVEIKDLNPTCLKEFLHYIYFNRLSQNVKLAEEVKDLLIAAEKYNVVDLKTLCENKLTAMLSPCNVGDIGRFANRYNTSYLREHVVHYVVNNYQELVKDPDGQWDIMPDDIIKDALPLLAK